MNEIKTSYRVDKKTALNNIEKELKTFIYLSIENAKNMSDKRLISLSIRISHIPNPDKRSRYLTIINTDVNIVNSEIQEIMNILFSRLQSRGINIKNIVSFHLHLNLANLLIIIERSLNQIAN